jgi:hypothetical protein
MEKQELTARLRGAVHANPYRADIRFAALFGSQIHRTV